MGAHEDLFNHHQSTACPRKAFIKDVEQLCAAEKQKGETRPCSTVLQSEVKQMVVITPTEIIDLY